MEMTWYGEPVETFEDVIQPLTNIVGYASKLPKIVDKTSDFDSHFRDYHIDSKIQKYLNNPANVKRLEHYLDILEKVSDKVIEESFPIENWDDDIFMSPCNRQNVKSLIQDAKDFITKILNTHEILTPKSKPKDSLKNDKSPYAGDILYLNSMKEALIKFGMIDNTSYFSEILRGKVKDKKINWKMPTFSLHYFIDELFKTNFFSGDKWIFAKNCFTIKGVPVPPNIGRVHKNEIKKKNQIILNIDKVIEALTKQTFSLPKE